jgi:hypothetical protein
VTNVAAVVIRESDRKLRETRKFLIEVVESGQV